MTKCTNATHIEEHQKKQETGIFFLSPVEKHISES